MSYCDSNKFFLSNSLLLGILFLILFFVFPVGGAIDMYFIQPWIDSTGHFPLKNNWFLIEVNHKLLKHIIIAFYITVFISWIASFKVAKLKSYQWQLGYLFIVSVLSTAVIGIFKSHSAHACPWSMTAQTALGYVWDFSASHGGCFPGGACQHRFFIAYRFFCI